MSASKVYSGSIAIVGGGISGLSLAIALLRRGFNVHVYEQARHFHEIGAGVAFHTAAINAMHKCDPAIYDAYQKVVTYNKDPAKKYTYFDFFDGQETRAVSEDMMKFTTGTSTLGFNSVHRADFLDELIKLVPDGVTTFGKRLETIDGPPDEAGGNGGKYTLRFADGTTAEHDVVVGTDGIKSAVRAWMVGPDHPSAHPTYTHKYAYRGLIPMDKAVAELGEEVATNAKLYMGPDGHVLTFGVKHGDVMNVVAFKTDPGDWPDYKHLTRHSTKEQVYADFKGFGHTVTHIINLLDPKLDCWAIFDTGSHPLQRYSRGRVLVLGDAGHATSPHHGSGAGLCIEDAAVLAELLTDERVTADGARGIENAFEAFSAERYGRTHRLVQSSRRAGELYEGRTELGFDYKAIEKELHWRYMYFWNGDIEEYIKEAKRLYGDLAALD